MPNRYFAVGDIHGDLDKLQRAIELIKELQPPGCKVIFLGDYIDRGPDSLGCLELVSKFQNDENGYEVITLSGNHEMMFVDAFNDNHNYYDYSVLKQIMDDDSLSFWVSWMDELDLYHFEGENVFAHAHYDPDQNWPSAYVWPRYHNFQDHTSGYHLTHGHTPNLNGPVMTENRTCLDTGAVFNGGKLTIAEYFVGQRGPEVFHFISKNSIDSVNVKDYSTSIENSKET